MPRNPKPKFKPLYRVGQRVTKQAAFSGGRVETVTVINNRKPLYTVRGERREHLPAFGEPIKFIFQHELVALERAAEIVISTRKAA